MSALSIFAMRCDGRWEFCFEHESFIQWARWFWCTRVAFCRSLNIEQVQYTMRVLLNFWRLQWTQEGFLENLMVNFCQNHFQTKLRSYLENKNIGVFINSVGVSFPVPQMLHDVKSEYPKLHSNLINVNLRVGYQFGTV